VRAGAAPAGPTESRSHSDRTVPPRPSSRTVTTRARSDITVKTRVCPWSRIYSLETPFAF